MGKKLDAILGKSFKTRKFKATVNLALSRIPLLKNQHHARCLVARSDVVEFLNLGQHDRALLRVEQVIKEQNMVDVLTIIESYCHLLIERINLLGHEKVCPDELKEAASSLIYANTRCGEFPELQQIRAIFISRFGKEFVARAVELRNNCGVNPQIIHKMSTRKPSLENKMKVLKEIASENNIVLHIEETLQLMGVEIMDTEKGNQHMQKSPSPSRSPSTPPRVSYPRESMVVQPEDVERVEDFSDAVKTRKYKDVADAAQAAFESAAYAAAAARAALELSRPEITDTEDLSSLNLRPRKVSKHVKSKFQRDEERCNEHKFEGNHSAQNYGFENQEGSSSVEQFKLSKNRTQFNRSSSGSSSDMEDENVNEMNSSSDEERQTKPLKTELMFDESEDENEHKNTTHSRAPTLESYITNETPEGSRRNPNHSPHKFSPFRSETQPGMESWPEHSRVRFADEIKVEGVEHLNINKHPISVKTEGPYGQ